MAELRLPSGHIAYIDDGDEQLCRGLAWFAHIDKRKRTVYARAHVYAFGKVVERIALHRHVMGIKKGDRRLVDHRDGDGLNCRTSNLRVASHQQNMANRKPYNRRVQHASTGPGHPYKGVTHDRGRWRAQISGGSQGATIYLGRYLTADEAAHAYDRKAIELFGEFAWLNFPHNRQRLMAELRDPPPPPPPSEETRLEAP